MHEDYINRVRAIGKSLIENAESIVGTEKYLFFLNISADINPNEADAIKVNREFYPERCFEKEE